MRRLGGAAGRLFFVGTGGTGACKGLGAAPGFISSSLRGPRPARGRGSLSQAVMGGWLGSSGGPGVWGARRGADAGGEGGRASGCRCGVAPAEGELGRGQAGGGAGGGGRLEPGGWRGSGGGGGAGRRGAHLEVGEVASEVGGDGRKGQLPGGGWSAGRELPQSSMKIGFTNHRRPFPKDSSISHEQFS
eukprot:bmy_08702T0